MAQDDRKNLIIQIIFIAAALATLLPVVSSGVALLAGVAFGLWLGNPWQAQVRRATSPLLQASVMGLGAGMDLAVVGQVGLQGVGYTVIGITLTLGLGTLLGRLLRTDPGTSILVTSGTAICGGSAIAA